MDLPKKKYAHQIENKKCLTCEGVEIVLDTEGMKQLADILESHASLADFRTWLSFDTGEFDRLIKHLRGE